MAAVPQPLQVLANQVQAVAATVGAIAAAPPPALGGLAQTLLDIRHDQLWQGYQTAVGLSNVRVDYREEAAWNRARVLNASCHHDAEALTPLPLPFARVVPIATPLPPAPGAPANPPPPFVPAAIVIPPPHAAFPGTKAALRRLTNPNVTALLTAYGCPPQPNVAARRAEFARFIGARL
ncbi:hypothetical protein DFH06DRAFT_1470566 [Mycena polygramma]|nr:hypothetical protein DFH06DRAFT_1470566 [Mycena polygramma]